MTCYNLGYRVVAIDPKDLHDLEKINRITKKLQEKYPQSRFYGVGVEYGANLLINYAAKYPESFRALVSLGNPYDLIKS